ncbi:aminodeoxychorismate synthase, component I [Legionella quinlivanii]|uniref:aminodeoxychorismate synthase n=1 Tax=Legionella quinlivanii TaxID=45073 RepID=A0A364LIN2_9GAMM|nr:aminodeoxychorismate synthase component I [Legionella quinlivanii]RAP36298.1 aminodeoxychorismate synthase, component I [Legionella quinlivanii]
MFEYNILELSYPSNLCHNYSKFSQLTGFVLIESADQLRGRFDILTAFPYELVNEKHLSDLNNLFTYLDSLLPPVPSSCDLPFQGGAIGYFSYDLACQLAGIEMEIHPDMEGMPLFHLGLYDWAIIIDHHLKKVSLFAANTRKETPEIAAAMAELWLEADEEAVTDGEFKIQLPLCTFISCDDYQESFRFIQEALFQGRCYQANLTQGFSMGYEGNSYAIYQTIRAVNPVPYGAFIRLENADILSFSPECFLTYTQGKLTTSPIKGTARNDENEARDNAARLELINSEKNRAENIMIVDLLRNDLGKIAKTGSVRVTGLCELQSYKGVHHLVSHIEAECREDIGMFAAFGACFPGGSITGAPKLESMKVIAESEAFARGVYCGSIGYFSNHGRFDTNIAIRTITAKGNKLLFAAGGGIVIDSECDKEYDECFIKINPILKGLLENGK